MQSIDYDNFLESKKIRVLNAGFSADLSKYTLLKDFQKFCVSEAILKGRFAFFEDCGLGK